MEKTIGLSDEMVKASRIKYGTNSMTKKNNNSFIKLLLSSLGDPIIKILLIALAIKIFFLFKSFDIYETIGILIAIFLASFISSISEYGSNKAFERLLIESSGIKVKVYRNNKIESINIEDVVVGDIVKLTSGDKVPADGYIIKGELSLDESFITGEAKEIYKGINNDKKGRFLYKGSTIYKGDGLMEVSLVGDKTFMGGISYEVQCQNDESPLKERLRRLAKEISTLGYIGSILASMSYFFMQIVVNNHFNMTLIISTIHNFPLMMEYIIYALTLSVTIIIMAVPEGLPMMITLVLSSNMKRMLKENVLVRRLVGIETSGSLNTLLCDKTGTLTLGKLKVSDIIFGDGTIFNKNSTFKYKDILYTSLYLNNESEISNNTIIGGNITDRAIKRYVKSYKPIEKVINQKTFDSVNKYSYVKTNMNNYYIKGASEKILPLCKYYLSSNGEKRKIDNIEFLIKRYTSKGYRVLLNAYGKDLNDLTIICLIILSDEIRNNAKESIRRIENAGIKVVMITGDDALTARKIGNDLGLINEKSIILTHDDIEKMSDSNLSQISDNISIIARALPEDKARLVGIYKSLNKVVGMTGDGVNDAIALKKSDVGFALGSGSEVCKESSDIVILDDNISSICNAILYGRCIFKSIRKFVTYQLTVNICALILSIVGCLIHVTTPITIVQMLWLNMIMDTFAGLAFSYEAPLIEYLDESPKRKDEKIMNKYMINQILVNGLYSSILCILFLKLPIIKLFIRGEDKFLLTAFFALFIFLGIINAFLSRTHRLNLFSNILKNKVFILINLFIFITQIIIIYYGGSIFRTYGLTIKELLFVLSLSFTLVIVDFIRKITLKKHNIKLGM